MTKDAEELRLLFSVEIRDAIASLHEQLSKEEQFSESKTIEDQSLKQMLAITCLLAIEQAKRETIPLKAAVSLLSGFSYYEYGDALDEAFALLHEIDMENNSTSEESQAMQFKTLQGILTGYGDI